MTPRVVCIGIATLDAIVVVDRVPGTDERVPGIDGALAGGGVAATAAVTLARLGQSVAFVGRVGQDDVGRTIRDGLAAEGVDVAGLAVVEGARSPLSTVLVERATSGRALAPFPGDLPPIRLDETTLAWCAAADWIHLDQFGAAVLPALRDLPRRGRISLDGGVPVPGLSLDGVDLYAPTEAALLAAADVGLDDAAAAALRAGPTLVVVTRGADGSSAFELDPAGALRRIDAPAIAPGDPLVSTLGAGDVFHGALLAALLGGRPLPHALHRANAVAALACRGLDGRSAIPSETELDAFLSRLDPAPGPGGIPAHAID